MTLAHSEMPTPERVRSGVFTPTRLGRRGSDESEVHAFCEWIADGLGLLLNDNNMLQAEIMRLRERLLEGRIQPEDAHLQAVQVLSKAQQTADRYVADAQEYSRELAEEARLRRDEILRKAKVRASMILEDAHTTATKAAGAARDTPEPLSAAERQDLQAEIAYLRTFSDVCRTHLRAYLESLTRSIDEWETASTTAPSPQATRSQPAARPSTSNRSRHQASPATTPLPSGRQCAGLQAGGEGGRASAGLGGAVVLLDGPAQNADRGSADRAGERRMPLPRGEDQLSVPDENGVRRRVPPRTRTYDRL